MFILSQNSLQLSRGRPLPLASILASETSKVSCLSTFLWYLNYRIYRARRRVAGALGRQCLQRLAQWPFWGAVGGGGGRDLRSPSIPLQPLRSPASLWCSTLGSFPEREAACYGLPITGQGLWAAQEGSHSEPVCCPTRRQPSAELGLSSSRAVQGLQVAWVENTLCVWPFPQEEKEPGMEQCLIPTPTTHCLTHSTSSPSKTCTRSDHLSPLYGYTSDTSLVASICLVTWKSSFV